jgi:hypothetical protein
MCLNSTECDWAIFCPSGRTSADETAIRPKGYRFGLVTPKEATPDFYGLVPRFKVSAIRLGCVPTANVTEAIAQAESEVTDDNKDSGGLL